MIWKEVVWKYCAYGLEDVVKLIVSVFVRCYRFEASTKNVHLCLLCGLHPNSVAGQSYGTRLQLRLHHQIQMRTAFSGG